MTVHQQLSVCLNLIESMGRHIRADNWQKLSTLESEYSSAFAHLKTEVAEGAVDADDVQSMMRLEQQQRRLQRALSLRLKETAEKLSAVEGASKRLQTSSKAASALAAG